MAKMYEKNFKVMIVELLNSGRPIKEISEEYQLNDSMLRRWKREYSQIIDSTQKPVVNINVSYFKNLQKDTTFNIQVNYKIK